MSKRDRAAVDVDTLPVPPELFPIGDRLRGKGLVGFDQIVIADLRPSFFHQIANGFDRREEKIFRIGRACRVPGDASKYLEVVSVSVLLGDNDKRSRAIIKWRCIARSDSQIIVAAVLPRERRPEFGKCLESRVFARTFVRVDCSRSLFPGDLYRCNLALELASFDRAYCLAMRCDRKLILVLSRYTGFPGGVFAVNAHMYIA